jgi:hypothetical protein
MKVAFGRFDPFAKPSGNDRYLRILSKSRKLRYRENPACAHIVLSPAVVATARPKRGAYAERSVAPLSPQGNFHRDCRRSSEL